jgi:TonB-dependent SusC/RagA subfamily outer membrane receptor
MKLSLGRFAALLLGVGIFLLALSLPLAAQDTGEIRGKVTDATRGDALAGANVVLNGTNLGAASDLDGLYTIRRVPAGPYTVTIRYVGYKTQSKDVTVRAGGTATVDFALAGSAVQMDEVVVTGQGAAIEKRRLPSVVETISAKDVQNAPVKSIDQLLQGRVPGMMSFAPGGAPGTASRIQTRGVKSALSQTTPVIYVDGVRVDNNVQGRLASGTGGQISSSLADLVTGEIDHVEIIKGGAAATLYGSEAANGVIQIFTKKGTPGASRWTANFTSGFDAPKLKNVWSDYTKTHYFQNGPFQSYRVGVDGGTDNLTYTVSAKMSENKGVSVKDQLDDKLYNISAGLRSLIGEKSSVEFSSSYTRNTFGKQFNDNAIAGVLATLEIEGSIEPQRTTMVGANQDSVLNAYLLPDLKETVNRWIASSNFSYNPFSWWQNKVTLGVDYRKSESRQFASIEAGPVVSTPGGYVNRSDREYMTLTANYNAIFTLPDLGPVTQRATAGAQAFRINDREISGSGTNFKIPGTQVFSNASTVTGAESNRELYSYGFIFQDQIGVWNKLYFDLGVRIDGNTTFGGAIPSQVYPKAGVAYNVSEESFYPEDLKSYVSDLKLRASIGQTGQFPTPYTRDRSYQSNPYGTDAAINFGNPGNSNLGPDKTTSIDLGADMGLLNDRVSVEFSWYKQTTKNARFNLPPDVASGFTTNKQVNLGEIQNTGIELSIRANVINMEDFQFNARASYSTNDNVVTDMGGVAEFTVAGFAYAPMRVRQGSQVGILQAFQPRIESDGLFKANTDAVYIGGPTPTKLASLALDFVIMKDLTVTALAEGAFGHYVLNQGIARRLVNALSVLTSNTPNTTNNPVIPAGQTLYYDVFSFLNWPINAANGQFIPRNNASAYLVDRGDWIKVREISARYRVPREWFNGVFVTASVRNPFTIMQKARYADPESSFIPNTGIELGGIVGATVEAPIQWRFGIDVTL